MLATAIQKRLTAVVLGEQAIGASIDHHPCLPAAEQNVGPHRNRLAHGAESL